METIPTWEIKILGRASVLTDDEAERDGLIRAFLSDQSVATLLVRKGTMDRADFDRLEDV